jgi:hypothetical protein
MSASISSRRAFAARVIRAIRAIRSCRGSIARCLCGRGDAADLAQDREPLLPRPAELGRKPQQRPQSAQHPLIEVRVQVRRPGGGPAERRTFTLESYDLVGGRTEHAEE